MYAVKYTESQNSCDLGGNSSDSFQSLRCAGVSQKVKGVQQQNRALEN